MWIGESNISAQGIYFVVYKGKHESCSTGFSSYTKCSPLLCSPTVFSTRRVVNQLFVSDREKTFKSQDVKQFALTMDNAWKVKLPQYQGVKCIFE